LFCHCSSRRPSRDGHVRTSLLLSPLRRGLSREIVSGIVRRLWPLDNPARFSIGLKSPDRCTRGSGDRIVHSRPSLRVKFRHSCEELSWRLTKTSIPASSRKLSLHSDMAKKIRGAKSAHLYKFTARRKTCPSVILNGLRIPQAEDTKYLGLDLKTKLEKAHIHQTETIWNSTEQDVLAARQQVAAVNRK